MEGKAKAKGIKPCFFFCCNKATKNLLSRPRWKINMFSSGDTVSLLSRERVQARARLLLNRAVQVFR